MMTKENKVFEGLKQGLEEAIADASGKPRPGTRSFFVKISDLPDYSRARIKKVRNQLGLSQVTFAKVMGVHVKTVEAWESGRNQPNGPALRMLDLLRRDGNLLVEHQILISS